MSRMIPRVSNSHWPDRMLLLTFVLLALAALASPTNAIQEETGTPAAQATGVTIRVPDDMPSIRGAIEAAQDGDTVLVAPGVYHESLVLEGKSVTLASEFLTTGDEERVRDTILDGTLAGAEGGRMDRVILVGETAGEETRIVGFTIQNGDDGISCEGNIRILHNRFIGNVDAIDYEGGGGLCAYNVFERNEDDGIDLDGPCEGIFEHNVIRDNKDDGIEIRLHPYTGPLRRAVIRHNVIEGNGEDGIQFIDYPLPSNREFRIERNVIANNAMAGIGCMGDTNTRENYEAADIDEPVLVLNNTIAGNTWGITGGNCFVVVNTIISDSTEGALKAVNYQSTVSHVVFWNNGRDLEKTLVAPGWTLVADPKLDGAFRPVTGSPCIDAGVADFHQSNRPAVQAADGSYSGAAPDIGAYEWVEPEQEN